MRTIVAIALCLIASTSWAQDVTTTLPDSSVIVTELQGKLEAQRVLIADLREIIGGLEAKLKRFEDANKPTPAAKITMESIDNCEACRISDSRDAARYRAAGWLWETVKVRAAPGRMYPRYRVCIGDTCEIVEIRNLSELDGKIQSVLDRRAR